MAFRGQPVIGAPAFATPTGDVHIGDAAAQGVGPAAASSQHRHAFPAPLGGYVTDIGASLVDGALTAAARADHAHRIQSLLLAPGGTVDLSGIYARRGATTDAAQWVAIGGNDSQDGLSSGSAKATIAAAIAALPTGGGTVFVVGNSNSSYAFTGPLALTTSNLRLVGVGLPTITAAGTEAIWNGDRAVFEIAGSTLAHNITVEGFRFACDGLAEAIAIYGGDGHQVLRNLFTGTATANAALGVTPGLGVGGSGAVTGCLIAGNKFRNTGTLGVRLYSAAGRTIDHTVIAENDFTGQNISATVGTGAIFLDAADVLSGTIIANNQFRDLVGHTTGSGGYANAVGGGLSTPNVLSDTLIAGNRYMNSRANQRQGFAHIYQATRTTIIGNVAAGGGPTCEGPFFAPGRTVNPMIDVKVIGNSVDSFDAFWDPDSMRFVEVANNIVRNCGAGLVVGYGTQQYVWIHHNIFYNSVNAAYPAAIVFGNATATGTTVSDNLIIDDRGTPVITRGIELTGGYSFADAHVRNNRIYVPSSAGLAFVVFRELGTETVPRLLRDNEIETSAGVALVNGGGTPAVGAGANAGTGATVTVVGDDRAGTITLTTGTGPTAGTYVSLDFAAPYAVAPSVTLTPANGTAIQQPTYVNVTNTGFSIDTGAALGASTAFIFNYQVGQR